MGDGIKQLQEKSPICQSIISKFKESFKNQNEQNMGDTNHYKRKRAEYEEEPNAETDKFSIDQLTKKVKFEKNNINL